MSNKETFKKYWVFTVNNYICDASYNGNELKDRHPLPTFRKFYFIKNQYDLKGFTKRNEISNEDLVKKCLNQ